jgi:nucleotidyltransferase substrate binding protein (TIGR01987 family)
MMTSGRTKIQIEQFERALQRMHEALELTESDIVRDALIKRFEFTFETAWRSVRRFLADRGEQVPELAYAALQKGFQAGLIRDPDLWIRMRQNRNLTSHTYREDIALDVAAFVRGEAVTAFETLLAELKRQT